VVKKFPGLHVLLLDFLCSGYFVQITETRVTDSLLYLFYVMPLIFYKQFFFG